MVDESSKGILFDALRSAYSRLELELAKVHGGRNLCLHKVWRTLTQHTVRAKGKRGWSGMKCVIKFTVIGQVALAGLHRRRLSLSP